MRARIGGASPSESTKSPFDGIERDRAGCRAPKKAKSGRIWCSMTSAWRSEPPVAASRTCCPSKRLRIEQVEEVLEEAGIGALVDRRGGDQHVGAFDRGEHAVDALGAPHRATSVAPSSGPASTRSKSSVAPSPRAARLRQHGADQRPRAGGARQVAGDADDTQTGHGQILGSTGVSVFRRGRGSPPAACAAAASPMPRRGRGRSTSRSSAMRPSRSTTTRSASATASATSWVMSTVVKPCSTPDARKQLVHLGAGQRIERAERLVEEQHAGPAHQRARQRHALLLAAGEDGRPVVARGRRGRHRRAPPAPSRASRARGRCRHCRSPAAIAAGANPGRAAGRSAAGPSTGAPPTSTRPPVGVSSPAIRRSSVVLPPPERPTTARNCAGRNREVEVLQHAALRRSSC